MRMRFFPRKGPDGRVGRCRDERSMYTILNYTPETRPMEVAPRLVAPVAPPHPRPVPDTPPYPTEGDLQSALDALPPPEDILPPDLLPAVSHIKRRKKRTQAALLQVDRLESLGFVDEPLGRGMRPSKLRPNMDSKGNTGEPSPISGPLAGVVTQSGRVSKRKLPEEGARWSREGGILLAPKRLAVEAGGGSQGGGDDSDEVAIGGAVEQVGGDELVGDEADDANTMNQNQSPRI